MCGDRFAQKGAPFDDNADGELDEAELRRRDKSAWRLDLAFLSPSTNELILQKTASANAYIGLAVAGAVCLCLGFNDLAYANSHLYSVVLW